MKLANIPQLEDQPQYQEESVHNSKPKIKNKMINLVQKIKINFHYQILIAKAIKVIVF